MVNGDAMSRNATLEQDAVSPAQERAIEALMAGATVTDAAKAANVSRQSLHRWRRDDYSFVARLNAARRDLREEVEHRLQALASEAIDSVSRAIQGGDARAGLSLLKGLGLLSGERVDIGEEDPVTLLAEAELAERRAANKRALDEICPL